MLSEKLERIILEAESYSAAFDECGVREALELNAACEELDEFDALGYEEAYEMIKEELEMLR